MERSFSGQVRCAGDLYVPDGIDDLAPAVVMGHSVTMVKEALAPHAEYLVRAGFVVLAGEGATIPALASDDPKLAGYVAQAEELFPTFRNQLTLESLDHVLLWAPVRFTRRLAPTPLLLVTGVDDPVHAIDEVLEAYDRALEPKRLELLVVDEFGLSIEPGLGQSMNLAAGFFDQHLRRAPRFVPSPTPRRPASGACAPSTTRPPASGRHHEPGHAGPAAATGPGRGRAHAREER